MRIAAGVVVPFGVAVPVALVVVVVGKEQGGPGRFTWCRSWCRIAGGVARVRLVRAG